MFVPSEHLNRVFSVPVAMFYWSPTHIKCSIVFHENRSFTLEIGAQSSSVG